MREWMRRRMTAEIADGADGRATDPAPICCLRLRDIRALRGFSDLSTRRTPSPSLRVGIEAPSLARRGSLESTAGQGAQWHPALITLMGEQGAMDDVDRRK
jgi:hypothetical protein